LPWLKAIYAADNLRPAEYLCYEGRREAPEYPKKRMHEQEPEKDPLGRRKKTARQDRDASW